MAKIKTAGAILALLAFALTGFAQAQVLEKPAFVQKPPPAPFTWAKSGAKAAFEARTAAAGGKVVGGMVSAEGAWPWQVALLVADEPVGPDAQFCGGTMVLDTWVLTAAHCVHMQDDAGIWGDLDPAALTVLVGANTIAPGKGDLITVAQVFRHPDYVGTEFDHDIALLKLSRVPNVPYAIIQVPDAPFADQLDEPGVVTVVTGWGLLEGGGHPEALHEAEIQMLDRDLCNQSLLAGRAEGAADSFGEAVDVLALNDDDAYAIWDEMVAKSPKPLSENMLCSGTFEGGKTACSGDSGGPLVVPLQDGTYVQAGVVSWGMTAANGEGCEETALFSAYTRVSNFLPWLDAVIGANP